MREDLLSAQNEVSSAQQQPSVGARSDKSWSPDRAAALLKAVLYISVVGVGWLVLRSSIGREVDDMPDSKMDEPNSEDYSPWEPAS